MMALMALTACQVASGPAIRSKSVQYKPHARKEDAGSASKKYSSVRDSPLLMLTSPSTRGCGISEVRNRIGTSNQNLRRLILRTPATENEDFRHNVHHNHYTRQRDEFAFWNHTSSRAIHFTLRGRDSDREAVAACHMISEKHTNPVEIVRRSRLAGLLRFQLILDPQKHLRLA